MSKHERLSAIRAVPTGWTDTLLICRKCSKKLHGGFGPDGGDTLRQAVRGALRASGRRGQVGIIEVGCLGICPKHAVTTMQASQPGALQVVPKGFPAERLLPREPVA